MPLTSYTIIVGDEGVISYNTDPIGEHFTQLENQIEEESSEIKDDIADLVLLIGSPPEPDEDGNNISVMDYVRQLEARILALENPISPPETT